MASYSDEDIDRLNIGLDDVKLIRDRMLAFLYPVALTNLTARKYLEQGVLRRASLVAKSIQAIFKYLPPETSEIPSKEVLDLVTLQIQANIINTYGLLDCWAHVWVNEFSVSDNKEKPLSVKNIGLGRKYKILRSDLTPALIALLDRRDGWIDLLTRYRDTLAHRIPPYIPPYLVDPRNEIEYTAKRQQWNNTLDPKLRSNLDLEIEKLSHFKAIMFYELEDDPGIFFHAQLLANFLTIEEISTAFVFGIHEKRKKP